MAGGGLDQEVIRFAVLVEDHVRQVRCTWKSTLEKGDHSWSLGRWGGRTPLGHAPKLYSIIFLGKSVKNEGPYLVNHLCRTEMLCRYGNGAMPRAQIRRVFISTSRVKKQIEIYVFETAK